MQARVGLVGAVAWLAGCLTPAATTCEDGTLCSAAQVCAPAGGCVDPDQLAACDGKLDGDACDFGLGVGVCAAGVCVLGGCGNTEVEAGEACDDGNTTSGDGCRGDCAKVEVCGDAVVDAGEACDDGNGNDADGCDACVATTWAATALLAGAVPATSVALNGPRGVAVDRAGNVYVADSDNHRVRRIAIDGSMTTVAGTGRAGFSGDGGAATAAQLSMPMGVAIDGVGSIYIADAGNVRVRRVGLDGTIATVAGSGVSGFGGDGGPATAAVFGAPWGVAVDGLGNLYIADAPGQRIRRVGVDGLITTIAGTGAFGFNGDGGAATAAQLYYPRGVALDAAGAVYVADSYNQRVRRIDPGGIITTVAGNGTIGNGGDGGPATAAQLYGPAGVTFDAAGVMFIADMSTQRIRRVGLDGTITTVAGTSQGDGGDGGLATAAQLANPAGVAVDRLGTLYIADQTNQRIRQVASDGIITTIAGASASVFPGDGALGTVLDLGNPYGAAVDAAGRLYVTLVGESRVLRLDLDGTVTSVAGNGLFGSDGDGGPAITARLGNPISVVVDAAGAMFISDTVRHTVRRVAVDGTITTIAGSSGGGFGGDGMPATQALLSAPAGLAVDEAGNLYIADAENQRIRRVASDGIITTVAGNGTTGFAGDGGAATAAALSVPTGVAVDDDGSIYIADVGNHRIRRVAPGGVITTIAGTGTPGFSGDGGPATAAQFWMPSAIALDADGALVVVDSGNHCVRRIDPGGAVTTVIGTGVAGARGDGGPATAARLNLPGGIGPGGNPFTAGVAVDGTGNVYVVDSFNRRVRRVAPDGIVTTVAGRVEPEGTGALARATLADPQAIVPAAPFTLFAGGTAGVVQALPTGATALTTVAGRYPHEVATGNLARFRDVTFGSVGGVAYDASAGVIYLAETSASRLHVVTVVDPDDVASWTIASLGADTAGFADGALATSRFRTPRGLWLDDASRTLYVADSGNHVIRAIDLDGQTVTTIVGTPATRGFFGDDLAATDALLDAPGAVRLAASGDLYIADTGNHRVRRVTAGAGVITTVLGDGVAASSGEGAPAWTFPVNAPAGLTLDARGNLFVTSSTAVRLLPADDAGVVDGTGPVQTIYGAAPRDTFPALATSCLTGVAVIDPTTVHVTDACTGLLVELARQPVAP